MSSGQCVISASASLSVVVRICVPPGSNFTDFIMRPAISAVDEVNSVLP